MRACLICGAPSRRTRCPRHSRGPNHERSTTERGYGADHQDRRLKALARAGADRHGIGGRCVLCGLPGTPQDPLQADHVVPLSLGGGTEVQAMHRSENISKGGANR